MKKLIFFIIVFVLLDIYLYKYYLTIENQRIPFEYIKNDKPLIYQKKEILLNSIDDFVFEDYFSILSFDEESYNYDFIDGSITIKLKNNEEIFKYPYELIEPEIIEKTIYKTITEYVETSSNNVIYEEYDVGTHLIQDYFCFTHGTDLGTIISTIGANAIESDEPVTCDYSALNPNEIGLYEVNLYTNDQIFTIICEIN